MNTIVQKGIAGLGNRLSVLGWCLDKALKYDAALLPDWRDSSWRTGFEDCFAPLGTPLDDEDLAGAYWPAQWNRDNVFAVACAKASKMMPACRTAPGDIDAHRGECDVFVACQYLAPYSDAIFGRLHIQPGVRSLIRALGAALPDEYACYHIRNTDKRTDDVGKWLDRAGRDALPVVVITDSMRVKRAALDRGLACTSIIPEDPGRGGVHHSPERTLAAQGLDRSTLNQSAVADMFVAGLAARFVACCPDSSYSRFIERGRKADYFKKEMSL